MTYEQDSQAADHLIAEQRADDEDLPGLQDEGQPLELAAGEPQNLAKEGERPFDRRYIPDEATPRSLDEVPKVPGAGVPDVRTGKICPLATAGA